MSTNWFVYILCCGNGKLYTGITTNLEKRYLAHRKGKGSKAVRAFGGPVQWAYHCLAGTHSKALKEEARIKKMTRAQKLALIATYRSFQKCI